VVSPLSGRLEIASTSQSSVHRVCLALIECSLERWVSVKIMTADETKRSRERNSLKAISAYSQENPGSKYIVTLLDDFIHYGPNGCHQCLVFELHGPTINLLVECYQDERLEPETILRMATQLLQALAFLHEAGFAHGGK